MSKEERQNNFEEKHHSGTLFQQNIVERGVIERGSGYNPVLPRPKESESCLLSIIKLGFPFTRGRTVHCVGEPLTEIADG
jgi:hypothetical protein